MDTTDIALEDRGVKNLYEGAGWIKTHTGQFNLLEPEFNIVDIAYASSMNCRFNGHVSGFMSVAEHCVNVSRIMRITGGDCKAGLLHDATEAYLTDVPAPFKQFLPDWCGVDEQLQNALDDHFDVEIRTPEVKHADWLDLFMEAFYLVNGKGEDFNGPEGLREEALALMDEHPELAPKCLEPTAAFNEYMTVAKIYGLS